MKTRTFFGKVFFALCLFLLLSSDVWSQNNVGIGTTTPDNSAILELYSTSHGFLVPRLTTTQRNAISSPATGLLIYNLDNQRFEYYNGTQWIGVVSSVATVPFNLISTGTNTTATMTVGSGASILLGGGTIESNVFKGTGSVSDAVDLATAEVNGVLPIANGGTGLSTTPTNGQLLIGNGSGYTLSTLTAGNGITISNGSGSITISDANYGNEVEGSGSAGQVAFWNAGNAIAGNNSLYWDNTNSRLGVGTNIPQAKVHIENGELWLFNNGNNTRFVIGDNGTIGQYGWLQWDSNLDLFRIDQSNAPGDGLKLKGNFMTIGNVPVDEPLKVAYGMTELMRVTSTGNVGIGTTTPAEKLDVAGNFRLSGALMPNGQAGTSGQVLVSQGAGNPPIWSSSISSLESDPIWSAAISGSQTITGNWTFSNTISGSISGNSGTATALQTARNFSLSGDVTSPSVSFNGTADVVLNSTIANDAVTSSKILNGTILNEDISASAGIDVSKLSVTQNNIIVGNGSNVGSLLAPGSNGQVLGISGGNISWITIQTLPSGSTGQTLRYNGGWEATNLIFNDVSNNRVGINITTPNALLHQDQGTGNATYHKFTAGTTTGTGTTDGFDIGVDNSGNAQLRQNENLPMIFQTNGTERMRLLANGKLGIGTSTVIDSVLVQTYGDVYIDGDLIVTGNIDPKVVYLQPLASAPSVISKGAIYYDGTNDKLKVYDGSSWSPLVTQSSLQSEVASVAWKTTGNSGLSEASNFIGTTDNVGLKIKTNNSDRVYISSDGKVGVGTTSPNSTFSVEGSVSNKVSIVTTNTTLDETYHTVLANATSNITITLPTASSSNVGRIYVIKNINSGVVTISGSIEGASSMTLYEKQNVELISNGSTWVVTSSYQPVPPIGSIIAWHKDFSNTPALPYGWVECNGQTLNDPGSPYHNQVIPNLNGDPNGANSPGLSEKARMFLRGGTQSGNGENDAFQGHRHSISGNYNIAATCSNSGSDDRRADCASYGTAVSISIGDPTTDGTNGTPRTASETRPKNMSVVWIMRVK